MEKREPSPIERKYISRKGLNPNEWYVVGKTTTSIIIAGKNLRIEDKSKWLEIEFR